MRNLVLILLLCPMIIYGASFGRSVAFQAASAIKPAAGGGGGGGGAPAVEFTSQTNITTFTAGPLNWVTSGTSNATSRLYLLMIGVGDGTFEAPTTVNLNGSSILGNYIYSTNDANFCSIFIYWKTNPPANLTNDIYFSTQTKSLMTIAQVTITNVSYANFTNAIGGQVYASGSGPSFTLTSDTTSLGIAMCVTDAQNSLVNTTGTKVWAATNLNSDVDINCQSVTGASPNNTFTWTHTSSQNAAAAGITIKGP